MSKSPKYLIFDSSKIDHNILGNLTVGDVHTQYALLAGRATGQTINGGTAASETLTIGSTANATKGKILFGTSAYDEVNNRLGIGTTSPTAKLDVGGDFKVDTTTHLSTFVAQGNSDAIRFRNYDGETTHGVLLSSPVIVGLAARTSDNGLAFYTSPTNTDYERMRIDNTGNVGIGTTSPKNILTVNSAANSIFGIVSEYNSLGTAHFVGYGFRGYSDGLTTNPVKSAIVHQRFGSYAQGDMVFLVDTNADTGSVDINDEKFRIAGTGNVSINTPTPTTKFQLTTTDDLFGMSNAANLTSGKFVGLGFAGYIAGSGVGPLLKSGIGHVRVHNYGVGDMIFMVDGVEDVNAVIASDEKMRITHDGNVGIGTTSPLGKLHIATDVSNPVYLGVTTDATTKSSYIVSTQYGSTAEPEGYALLSAYSNASSNLVMYGGGLSGYNAANVLQFYTAADLVTRTGTERMRIDSAGKVGIGTTSPSARLHTNLSVVDASTAQFGQRVDISEAATSSNAQFYYGLYFTNTATGVANFNGGLIGIDGTLFHQGGGTMASATPYNGSVRINSSGNITSASIFAAKGHTLVSSSGTITTLKHFVAAAPTYSGTGKITNQYGLYIEDLNGDTTTYGIYMADQTATSAANAFSLVTNKGNVVINEGGDANSDFRVEGDTDANLLFTDASADKVGIGTNAPSAKTHIISTTEQLRIGYDTSNYYKTTVGATGGVTFDAVGVDSGFVFSDFIRADADVWFEGAGSGLPYGGFYMEDGSVATTLTLTNSYYQIASGFTGMSENLMTFQNSKEVKILKAGKYLATWSLSVNSNTSDQTVAGCVMIGSTQQAHTEGATRAKENGVLYNISGTGIITCAENDLVSLCLENETSAGTVVTTTHANLTLMQVGG